MTQSGATPPGQSRPGSNGNKRVLRIPQSSSITGTSLSDCLVLYPRYTLRGSYLSAEMQSVYFLGQKSWLSGHAFTTTSWFGSACVRCRPVAQWMIFGSVVASRKCGRSQYTQLMRLKRMSNLSACHAHCSTDFLLMVIKFSLLYICTFFY